MVSELHIRPSVLAGPALGLLLVAGVAAARAGPEAALQGGVMTVVTPQLLDPDPAHAYDSDADKAIQAATGLFLLSLPDRTGLAAPVPDASRRPTVSRKRKIWRFVIKKGMRFSDGNAVGPQNFQLAINRNLHLKSIGGQLVRDIVGAPAVLKGTAQSASGITVSGDTLQIKLSSPSGDLDARLATPFFGALPLTLPNAPPFPSAGPYFIAGSTPGSIVLQENPFYGGTRPHHLDGFLVSSDPNRDNLGEVESGRADYVIGGVDSSAAARLGQAYGVNKGQFQVHPLLETDYVALNTSRPVFANVQMRKAANFAIDRPAMLRVRGAFAGKRTDQILPPGMGGFRDANIYPLAAPDYRAAKELAKGRCKRVNVYATTTPTGIELSHEFKYNLSQIGCDVNVRLFSPSKISAAVARGGYDTVFVGGTATFDDPSTLLNDLRGGTSTNLAHFNSAEVNKLLDRANRAVGPARYRAYGALDIMITAKYAPWAAYDNRNEREFVSRRTGGYLFQPANASADLNTFFLK